MDNKNNALTVEVKATEIDEVKDIIATFIVFRIISFSVFIILTSFKILILIIYFVLYILY